MFDVILLAEVTQHQYRCLYLLFFEDGEDGKSVHLGHDEVEEDEVKRLLSQKLDPVLAVVGKARFKACVSEG